MSAEDVANREEVGSELQDVLTQIRLLDPNCDVANVARFFREIDHALTVLQELDATGQPLPIAFDPHWPQEHRP